MEGVAPLRKASGNEEKNPTKMSDEHNGETRWPDNESKEVTL